MNNTPAPRGDYQAGAEQGGIAPTQRRAAPSDHLRKAVTDARGMIERMLPKHMNIDRFIAAVLSQVSDMEYKAQNVNVGSFMAAVREAISCGLEPGPRARFAVYGSDVNFDPGWQAMVEAAKRGNPHIRVFSCDCVHKNDHYKRMRSTERTYLEHEPPDPREGKPRGEIVAAYAFIVLDSGECDWEECDLEDLTEIQKMSRNQNLYKKWPGEMHRKAPVKRLCKRLNKTPEMQAIEAADNSKFDLSLAGKPKEPDPFTEPLRDGNFSAAPAVVGEKEPEHPRVAESKKAVEAAVVETDKYGNLFE